MLEKSKEEKHGRYEKIKKLGEGAYGSVTKVFDHQTKSIRALKKIKFTSEDDGVPINAIREVAMLKKISHPNIVKIFDVHYSWQPSKLYLSLEYIDQTLYEHLKRNQPLSPFSIKSYTFQALCALKYLHTLGIMHRDIKPQNLMITTDGTLKICDFGQAKIISINKDKYSVDVSTLWYRAPEILLGWEGYGAAADVWALGCVMAEMSQCRPLFKSQCEIGQIFQIFKVTGTPKKSQFPKLKHLSNQFPNFPKSGLITKVQNNKQALDLLQKMLQLDPNKRISAYNALRHPYFDGYDF